MQQKKPGARKKELSISHFKSTKVHSEEYEKGQTLTVAKIIAYVPESVAMKAILKKTTGHVTVSSFDAGVALMEKASPFDTFLQVIDGKAEIVINDQSHHLDVGQAIIIPAHARKNIKANVRFKMLSTVIKSGYEDVKI